MSDTAAPQAPATEGRGPRAGDWVHLIYLVIPAFQPIFAPDLGWRGWPLYALILVLFVPLYAAMQLIRGGRLRWRFTVPATALGIATAWLNPGAAVLFVYTAAAAGRDESRRTALRWYAGLTLLVGVFMVVSIVPMPWRFWALVPHVLFIWVVGVLQLEEAERERDAAGLRIQNARIEHLATMSERERIARDLHDLLGHSLTAVIVRAQLVRELAEADPARARAEAAEIESTAREALEQVRGAVRGWRQTTLEAELAAARATLDSAGVRLSLHRDTDLAIGGSTEHELALALREAVTNVARHAGARSCHIGIEATNGQVRVVVADDGRGGGGGRDGSGLTGMRERIAALGGEVRRQNSAGTTLTIAVPATMTS